MFKDDAYICPICFDDFETSNEKSKHLELIHGYECLDVTPIDKKKVIH